jgi:serine/threonine protein kinase
MQQLAQGEPGVSAIACISNNTMVWGLALRSLPSITASTPYAIPFCPHPQVKLIDLGMAIVDSGGKECESHLHGCLGSPGFIAPEVVRGGELAVGCIQQQMLYVVLHCGRRCRCKTGNSQSNTPALANRGSCYVKTTVMHLECRRREAHHGHGHLRAGLHPVCHADWP